MKALLYKDACVIWGQLKILVLLVALFCLMPQLRLNGFFLIYAGIMFPTTLMSFDERSKWDTLAGMLPYADRDRVLSRYVSGWAALAFGGIMCLLGYTIQGRGLGLAEVTGLVWLVALALGIQAVSFPILFRVGVEKGRICIWLIYVAAAILMAVLSNLGFPFHSALGVSAPLALLGGVVLLSGEPGVGKSTMLLQLCGAISNQHSVLYITGEESVRQVKLRAARLKVPQDNIFLAAENDVDEICGLIEKEKPDLVVIDSIQTMRCMDISSSSGTVSQVKESAARLLAVAKKQEIPMFIVGHVNKDGAIAGPKVMEHIVDTVLYFEGDKMLPYRILRAAKNRYGSTNELGMFDMTGQGLEEIENPSQMLLEGRPLGVSGNCVACTMEGSRPILSEIQALATKTNFPAPRRACSGYDYNRMNLLIAVLEKRAGYFFGNLDVYINIVGGIALRDTACDLSVCLSMVSSLLDRPVSDKLIAIGEVGLGGEVRSVPNLEQRLHEAERIGFERAVIPKHSLNHLSPADYPGMQLIGAAYITDAINALKSDRL